MFERFTKDARQVVIEAQNVARHLRHSQVRPEHILVSLLRPTDGPDSVARRVLLAYGVDPAGIERAVGGGPGPAGLTEDQISALNAVGIDVAEVVRRVEEAFGPGALDDPRTEPQPRRRFGRTHLPFTRGSKKVLELSLREALALNHNYIGSEHILLGLLRADEFGPAAETLKRTGITYRDARERVRDELRRAA